MRPAPVTLSALLLLAAGLAGCGEQSPGADEGCTEFTGQETTIGIRHGHGLSPDDGGESPGGEGSTPLGDLVRSGEGDDLGAVVTVFDSKASPGEPGLDANAAISRQVQRTGSGPYNDPMQPLETTEVDVAGHEALMASLTTSDDIVYTTWVLPGEKRSLDIVLAQSEASAQEVDLAAELPDLVRAGGCD